MPTKKRFSNSEKRLYPILVRGLEKKPIGWITRNKHIRKMKEGFTELGIGDVRCDVAALYHTKIGHGVYDYEVIAIEVKTGNQNCNSRTFDQVKRMSKFAHRCYLAISGEFKPEEKMLANEYNVGLIEIRGKRPKIVLPSGLNQYTDYLATTAILAHMGYESCCLCGAILNTGMKENFSKYTSYNILDSNEKRKNSIVICNYCLNFLGKKLFD